jgi:hypothetical protein
VNNLLRKCENCVFGALDPHYKNQSLCIPKLPDWVVNVLSQHGYTKHQMVNNFEAADCPAFRLRDTGVNE